MIKNPLRPEGRVTTLFSRTGSNVFWKLLFPKRSTAITWVHQHQNSVHATKMPTRFSRTRCTSGISVTTRINDFLVAGNILLTQIIDSLLRFFTFCWVFAVEFKLRHLKLCLFRHTQIVILNNNFIRCEVTQRTPLFPL